MGLGRRWDVLLAAALALAWTGTALAAGGFHRSTVLALAAMGISALLVVAATRGLRRPSIGVVLLGALGAWTMASALWGADDPLWAAALAVLYAAALWLAEQADPGALVSAFGAAILAICALALGARALGLAPTAGASSHRLEWPVTYTNGLGLVAATGVLLWLAAVPRLRGIAWVATVVCLATLLLTFSRSAVAGLVVALAILWALRHGRRARWGAVVAAVALLGLAPLLWDRFSRPAPDSRDASRVLTLSGHGRSELWHAAWRAGSSHPLLGVGAGSYRGPGGAHLAHSLELQTFAELGTVGLLLIVAFGATAAIRSARSPLVASVFGLWLVVSAVDWDWQLPAATLPALALLAASEGRVTLAR